MLAVALGVYDIARQSRIQAQLSAWGEISDAGGWIDPISSDKRGDDGKEKIIGVPIVFSQQEFDRLARIFPEARLEWTQVSSYVLTWVSSDGMDRHYERARPKSAEPQTPL